MVIHKSQGSWPETAFIIIIRWLNFILAEFHRKPLVHDLRWEEEWVTAETKGSDPFCWSLSWYLRCRAVLSSFYARWLTTTSSRARYVSAQPQQAFKQRDRGAPAGNFSFAAEASDTTSVSFHYYFLAHSVTKRPCPRTTTARALVKPGGWRFSGGRTGTRCQAWHLSTCGWKTAPRSRGKQWKPNRSSPTRGRWRSVRDTWTRTWTEPSARRTSGKHGGAWAWGCHVLSLCPCCCCCCVVVVVVVTVGCHTTGRKLCHGTKPQHN